MLWTRNKQAYDLDCDNIKIDVKDIIAKKAAKLLYGKGISVTVEDDLGQARIDEILDKNEFYQMNYDREIYNSKHGDMFWAVEYRGGMPVIYTNDQPDSAPQSKMAYVNRTRTAAVIWRRHIIDDLHIYMMENHTLENGGVKIKRMFMVKGKWVRLSWIYKQVDANLVLPEEEFFPGEKELRVFRVVNLPAIYGPSKGDLEGNEAVIAGVMNTWSALNHELLFNRTLVHGNVSVSQKKAMKKDIANKLSSQILSYAFIATKGDTSKGDSKILNVEQADPKLDTYWDAYWQAWDNAFNMAGYARRDQKAGQTYRNADDVFFSLRDDLETTELKRGLRTKVLRQLILKVIELEAKFGMGDIFGDKDKVIVRINDTFITDDQNSIEKMVTMLDNGLISHIEAIAKLRNISEKEAEQVFKQIQEGIVDNPFKQEPQNDENQENQPNGGE